ncbi:hypothetical protein EG327_002880 [Venturia inaequalis]|uniref:Uncharacterized protein n=1 Tax=Venturia inaequalis TaxID=5025 RepID=A0A8H3VM10_VENIN|nr:hypothetical protein EG327_002880 [Venturia inaequalis]
MPSMKQDNEQASSLAQAFTDLYRLGRQSVNQGDLLTAKRCFEQLVDKHTPSSFFGYFEEGLPGPDDKPTSTFILYQCSIIEPDGTETFAENCTFVIDACQRLAQLPNISCDQAAEYLEIAGKRIDYAVKDADIAPAIRAAIEPFKDRNEELKDEVQRRSEEQLLIVVENGQRRMQEAMVTGQDVFDQSYNTMNSGQFGTVAQGFMQDTLSFPARVPELVPDPVQLYTDSSAILSNQTWNANNQQTYTTTFPPPTEPPTSTPSNTTTPPFQHFPAAQFQPHHEQRPIPPNNQTNTDPRFNGAAHPFTPQHTQPQPQTDHFQRPIRRRRNREPSTGHRIAHGSVDRRYRHSSQGDSQGGAGQAMQLGDLSTGEGRFGFSYRQAYGHSAVAPAPGLQSGGLGRERLGVGRGRGMLSALDLGASSTGFQERERTGFGRGRGMPLSTLDLGLSPDFQGQARLGFGRGQVQTPNTLDLGFSPSLQGQGRPRFGQVQVQPPNTQNPGFSPGFQVQQRPLVGQVQVPFPNTPDPGPSSGYQGQMQDRSSYQGLSDDSQLRYNLDLIRMEMGDRLDLIKITDSLNLIKMGDRLDSIKITDSLDLIKITDSLHSIIITDSLDLIKITDSLNSIKITDSLDLIKITDNLNSIKITDNLNSVKITDSLNSIKMGDRLDLIKIADSLNSIKITDNLNSINSIR